MRTCPNVKINLGLNILRRRDDGFHDIETLFVPYFGVSDVLEIEEAAQFSIEIDHCGWNPLEDLTVRAYRLLEREFGLPAVRIRLEKHSPVGAGLGGGSSDAAFTLRMLNEMFSLGLSPARLSEYAARLGSDCAFFIYDRPMLGEGRGERLSPWEIDLADYDIRLEVPEGVSVSTAEAYRGVLDAKLAVAGGQPSLQTALAMPVECWKEVLVNDFERTIFPLHPEIARLKQRFYDEGAVYAAMSGSGSAVFGLFKK